MFKLFLDRVYFPEVSLFIKPDLIPSLKEILTAIIAAVSRYERDIINIHE
jgi:hypothetical protein